MNWEDAERVVAAAKSQALQMGAGVSIAVVDARGDLVALSRLDGARHFTVDFAQGKALVSAITGVTSGEASEDAATSVVKQLLTRLSHDRMVFLQGAVPLVRDGDLIGGIGVSGVSSTQDEAIASSGAAAL